MAHRFDVDPGNEPLVVLRMAEARAFVKHRAAESVKRKAETDG